MPIYHLPITTVFMYCIIFTYTINKLLCIYKPVDMYKCVCFSVYYIRKHNCLKHECGIYQFLTLNTTIKFCSPLTSVKFCGQKMKG